ncbi:MAG: DoxX family protein [FCB group bacterium]|nr:DoxX family protein [FCB group bacterium]
MDLLNNFGKQSHWLVRLSLFGIFIYHGLIKYPMAQGMADMMGMPVIIVYLLATAEVAGALLILYGGIGPDWSTQAAGAIFSIVMLGAIFTVHLKNGWNSINMGSGNMGQGMEFQVLILAVSVFFLTKGKSAGE